MLVTKFIELDYGHRIPNHSSQCFGIHGHRMKVVAGVDDKVIIHKGASDEGMVIDFSDLKRVMMEEIHSKVDHGFLMWEGDPLKAIIEPLVVIEPRYKVIFTPYIPTAENIAKWAFGVLKQKLGKRNMFLNYVEIYETPTSMARYTSDNWIEDMPVSLGKDVVSDWNPR